MDIPAQCSIQDEPDYLKELLAKAGVDAQASTIAAKLQEVVIGELHHRVKNTLAIVSAITSQSLQTAWKRLLKRSRIGSMLWESRKTSSFVSVGQGQVAGR